MLRSKSILTTLLASGLLFSRAQGSQTLLGYTTVSEEAVGANNNEHDNLDFHESLTPLGLGIYLVNNPADVKSKVISDDQMKDTTVWQAREETIVDYIQSLMPEPERALRFGEFPKTYGIRMLIPTTVIMEDDLELKTDCFESSREMRKEWKDIVPWETWDIKKGDRGFLYDE
ncbi:hypothetical protein LZ554_001553 [Drepanopeziza brunnea f. sp. 'monogermtubi']|nr:hypothetical protein LZ554_001553 [Drepanopeziza brunnea f. sp. 'monogermtubi']